MCNLSLHYFCIEICFIPCKCRRFADVLNSTALPIFLERNVLEYIFLPPNISQIYVDKLTFMVEFKMDMTRVPARVDALVNENDILSFSCHLVFVFSPPK